MLYQAYQAQSDLLAPTRATAAMMARAIAGLSPDLRGTPAVRAWEATCELLTGTRLTHRRPPYGIDSVSVDGRDVAVTEEVVVASPFGDLLRFAKAGVAPQPPVLVVAPLSGHFATLLRPTLRTLLPEHDVYVTDWHNARDVPVAAGAFGFDDYIGDLIRYLEAIGPGAHVVAVCQPCVAALAATAVMAQGSHPAQPRSLTLMAGPIDTRVNPTRVNELAGSKSLDWFAQNVITTVPWRHAGRGRRVYPGFLQVSAFMSMNLERHLTAHTSVFRDIAVGEPSRAASTIEFYREYFSVLDLTAEFYLETVDKVFQRHELGRGVLTYLGEPVEPAAIRHTAILTVEGERDDICAPGQTMAAHDLCSGVPVSHQRHHLQAGVGHYGVFSGRRWETQIYPIIRSMIQTRG